MEGLGSVLLDDRLMSDPISGAHYSVFLFQTMMFCCKERDDIGYGTSRYPVKPWELGAALSQTCALTLVHAVQTKNFRSLHCIDEGRPLPYPFLEYLPELTIPMYSILRAQLG